MITRFHTLTGIAAGLTIAASLSACSDEPLTDRSNAGNDASIAFNVGVVNNAWDLTRADSRPFSAAPVKMNVESTGDSLFLHTSVSDFDALPQEALTRGSLVASKEDMYGSFYVSAYQYEDSWSDGHMQQTPNYFQTEIAQKNGNIYTVTPLRYWPKSGKMRFLAHAPAGDNAFTFYGHDDASRGARVHINIADKVQEQNDLLISYTAEIACNGSNSGVPMNFKHALTGIRFVADKRMPKGIITNITIKGVRYEGDLFYNLEDAAQASSADLSLDANFNCWELYDKEFSLDLNYSVTGEDEAQITDGENTFMMLPQTLPDDATIEITLQRTDSNGNPTGQSDLISGSLAGKVWPAGKIVTYKLSNSGQVLEVENPAVFSYLGSVYNATDGSLLSYNPVKVASSSGPKNMKWKVEYMDSGTTAWSSTSSWLSVDPTWSWTDTPEQEMRFVAKSAYNTVDIDSNLKNAASKGSSASPYNLSNSAGASSVENSANCYMVDGPGYYILPLVYGNAITNSAATPSAYTYTAQSGAGILSNFENHLGAAITAPYITDNPGCVADHASIVWQDAQNLVQNVEYVAGAFGGKGGIKFYVSPATICQGNAVLAISDKNNIMWSWHIWVTNFTGIESTVAVTNMDNATFTVMPVNLGWCSNGETLRYYPRRECKVRFTPTEGDTSLSEEITFVQESHTSIPFGNNPYYQWGRKDPFVGTNIAWGNKERWDGTGKYYGTGSENNPPRLFNDLVEDTSEVRLTTVECLDLMIKNPDKWHNPPAKKGGSSYISMNQSYTNLWGDLVPGAAKTVYDPCPPGYQVNYYYTYTGFLDAGYNWASDTGIEFVKETAPDWNTDNLAEFYTDSSKLHSITFPVCGYRDWNDKAEVVDFKVRGFIWLRGCEDNIDAYMFRYAAHAAGVANVAPVTMFYATDGLPIRPALSN